MIAITIVFRRDTAQENSFYVRLRTETIVRLRENDTQASAFFSLL